MPDRELRILSLGIVADDAARIDSALRQDGLRFTTRNVSPPSALQRELATFSPDVVLFDHHPPAADGLSIVRLVRKADPDLPLVLVTGAMPDEVAVMIVKAGANDYVHKDRLARLPVAVRHALAEAETIRARRVDEGKIFSLAHTDPLTGLANRVAFLEQLRTSFVAARRGRFSFAVFYVDLDHFKDVNDSLGHMAGDRLLREVAGRLRRSVRETDVVARFGGDEFAVLQADIREHADAGTLAEKLCRVLAEPFELDGELAHVTTSIGIAIYRPDVDAPEDMLGQADLALYRAKGEGRNRFSFHTPDLDERVRERLRLTEELHLAIAHKQFELYYQPQIAQPDGRVVGLEALIRWHHPRRAILSPPDFLPIAERSGTMLAVGEWVLNAVCEQIAKWRAGGLPVVPVAINLSAAQLRSATGLDTDLRQAMARWHVAPEMIELELAEDSLLESTREHGVELQRVRTLGLKLVIDGFGVGPLSLDHIGTFGFSRLKIAPSFVAGMVESQAGAAIVRAAIGLAHELGITVVASGVETAAQLNFLTAAGCMVSQGYHICPPVPADRMADLLRDGRIVPGSAA